MRREILLAGRGGQGILLLGHVLGIAAAKYGNFYVTGTEAYDAETRGGDSRADLIIADTEGELDYMKVRKADIALFMHPIQARKYSTLVAKDALVFIDSTFTYQDLPSSWKITSAPYTKLSEHVFSTPRIANMIALGHMVKVAGIVSPESIRQAIRTVVKKEWIEKDIEAFNYGMSIS